MHPVLIWSDKLACPVKPEGLVKVKVQCIHITFLYLLFQNRTECLKACFFTALNIDYAELNYYTLYITGKSKNRQEENHT